jgi:hypothetical protein
MNRYLRLLVPIAALAIPLSLVTGASASAANSTATGAAIAPNTLAVHAVMRATPDDDCPSGYWPLAVIGSAGWFYAAVDGVDEPIDLSTDPDNCWHTVGFGDLGQIKNRDGYCMSYNSDYGAVYATACSADSWVQWQPLAGPDESNNYVSLYTAGYLSAEILAAGSVIDANQYSESANDEWYTGG